MGKKDFLQEKYCEINHLKSLLQTYPKEYCETIIGVMNKVFDEISDYLEEQNGKIKTNVVDKVVDKEKFDKVVGKVNKCKEVIEEKGAKIVDKGKHYKKEEKCEKEEKHKKKEKKCEKHKRQSNLTLEKLSKYNGKDGNPSYVAVNGTIYDVSNISKWKGGNHFGLLAGNDLTSEFLNCHSDNLNILQNADIVGTLIDSKSREDIKYFRIDEVAKYNGKNGNLAYVIVDGIVYDVTNNDRWKEGQHYGVTAGKDASEYFKICHKNEMDILKKLKVVGKIVE